MQIYSRDVDYAHCGNCPNFFACYWELWSEFSKDRCMNDVIILTTDAGRTDI